MSRLNWMRFDGAEFESLVHSILFFKEPNVILLGRPGKDSGQDAISGDGTHVYQAKYGRTLTMTDAIARAREELKAIQKKRKKGHPDYSVWSMVTEWTLVANFTTNRLDVKRWQNEIVAGFLAIGIKASYLDATDLENELLNLPDVEHAYFDGKNRAFVGLWEVKCSLEQGRCGKYYFATKMVGREGVGEKLSEMMESPDCRFIVVHGEAEVGKTRFLYEKACDLSEKGWKVLWGLSAGMTMSDSWMMGIGDSSEDTCLIVDAPKNRTLVQAVFEQLSIVGKRNWKVILSCQPSEYNDWFSGGRARDDVGDIELSALTEVETKKFVKAFADNCGVRLQYRAAEGLYSLTHGIPGWMSWMLSVSAENKQGVCIDVELLKSVKCHIHETIEKEDASRQNLILGVFRWVCAWKTVVVDSGVNATNAVIDFISAELSVTVGDVCDALRSLTDMGLVSQWGHNRKIYTAEPTLVQHQVLCEWLLVEADSTYQVSVEGLKFIEKLLKSDVPDKESVIVNLARLSSCYLDEDKRANFIRPITQELKVEAEHGSVIQQLAVLEWAKKIAPIDPEASLEIVCACWEHPKEPCVVSHRFWGEQTFSAAQLLSEIPWFLYSLTDLHLSAAASKKVWTCFKRIFAEENEGKFKAVTGQRAEELIGRLLIELTDRELFKKYAFDDLMMDCQHGKFSAFDCVLAKGLLSCRMESTAAFGRQFTFSHGYVAPGQNGWDRALKIRKTLFELRKKNQIPEAALIVWRVLSDAHYGWRSSVMLDARAATALKADYDHVVIDDLRTTLEILRIRKEGLGHAELEMARHLWVTALKYGKSEEERTLAQECEKEYSGHFKWSFSDFFSWDLEDAEVNAKLEQVKTRFRNAATVEEIVNYFTEAMEFLRARDPEHPAADCGRGLGLANVCRDLYVPVGENAFSRFIEEKLFGLIESNPFAESFAECFVRMRIKDYRLRGSNQNVAQELERLIGNVKGKGSLLCRVYEGMSSRSLGAVAAGELEYICSLRSVFSNYQFVRILPTFLAINQDVIFEQLKGVLGEPSVAPREIEKLWWGFMCNCYLVVLREDDVAIPNPICRLMDIFIEGNLNGACLESHELKFLAKKADFKFSQKEFCDLLRRRIGLEKKERLYEGYEIMPHGFAVNEWVEQKEDAQAIMEICKMSVEEHTFLSSYRIPEYLPDLDKSGRTVGVFVDEYLKKNKPTDRLVLYCLGCLCAGFGEGTPAWKVIAAPICSYMTEAGFGREDRYSVYAAFQPRMHTWSSAAGEVAPFFVEREAAARQAVENESQDSELYEFFVWSHNNADWALKSEKERVEADRHE